MADATDLPATGGETASAAESITTEPAAGRPEREPEPYRPLSLLAVAALGVAGVYSAVVIFGGLFAMLNRSPLLLPRWTFALPLLAACPALLPRLHLPPPQGPHTTLSPPPPTLYLPLPT